MNVLIIGASGFLGGTIYYKLKMTGVNVIGTYCNHRTQKEFVKLDVLDSQGLVRIIGEYLPDVVIWTVMNHNAEEEIADNIIPMLCDNIGDTRIIFVSTSVAYEKNMSEDVTPFFRTENVNISPATGSRIRTGSTACSATARSMPWAGTAVEISATRTRESRTARPA